MSIFARFIQLGAEMGQYAAVGAAQRQQEAEHRKAQRAAARASGGKPARKSKTEGCTPCAAKHKGAEMMNSSGIDQPNTITKMIWK